MIAALGTTSASPELPPASVTSNTERIEVTGSRIKRAEVEGPLPLTIVTREEMARNPNHTLTDILNGLAIVNAGPFTRTTAAISLRGLGANATLVLLNGRRVSTYGFPTDLATAYVDLNSIPLSAIERIEVLKDGASAIYGSDAIAGVVNIVLRRDFEGAEVGAAYRISDHGDAAERGASLLLGRGNRSTSGYNVMAALDYFSRDPLYGRDRRFSATGDRRAFGGPDFRSGFGSPGTWLTASASIPADQRLLTHTVFPDCPPESREQAVDPFGTCAYDTFPEETVHPEARRASALLRAEVVFGPASAFAELAFNRNETVLRHAAAPDAFVLPAGHNSNPFAFAVPIRYRFTDVGARTNHVKAKTRRVVAGLRGSWRGWDWEAAHVNGANDVVDRGANYIFLPARNALVDEGAYSFVDPSRNDPALASGLRVNPVRTGLSRMRSWDARLTGTLWETGFGPLAGAFGGEHRRERVEDIPDPRNAEGLVISDFLTGSAGSRSMHAAFAEFSVPIASRAEAQVAVRTERYQGYGSSTVPKLAVAYRPSERMLLRAGYNQGFRAPSLAELNLRQSRFFSFAVDTSRCNGYVATFGRSDPRTLGACGSVSVPTLTGGNASLGPENSEAMTLGLVWDVVPGLSLALDAYRIRHRERISTPDLDFVLANEDRFPGAVVRDAALSSDITAGTRGPITELRAVFYNAARQETAGLDFEARYRFGIGSLGRIELSSANSYLDYLRVAIAAGVPAQERAGSGGIPRYRGAHGIAWMRGPWDASLMVNVSGHYREPFSSILVVETPSWTTADLQATYSGFRGLRLTGGLRNVFDRDPPEGLIPKGPEAPIAGRLFFARIIYAFDLN